MIKRGSEQFSGYNKPKRTPNHPTKSHAVLAKSGDDVKLIRFGQQGVTGSPEGTARNKAFKARHAENIAKGKMSAAYWANKVKWWLTWKRLKQKQKLAKSCESMALVNFILALKKAQKLGGFELGSSVLLVVERPGKAFEGLKKLRPGLDLIYS